MRCCQLYLRNQTTTARDDVLKRLLVDPRVDQVLWRESAWNDNAVATVRSDHFIVRTADRGELRFRYAVTGDSNATDAYGNSWRVEGQLNAVGAELNGHLSYGDYPNALERIASGFSEFSGDMWVTARVGCEFELEETTIHRAGSHGSLHKDDSISPLLIAGLPDGVAVPNAWRLIDIAPIVLQVLDLDATAKDLVASRSAG
jgi:hypothetical protein